RPKRQARRPLARAPGTLRRLLCDGGDPRGRRDVDLRPDLQEAGPCQPLAPTIDPGIPSFFLRCPRPEAGLDLAEGSVRTESPDSIEAGMRHVSLYHARRVRGRQTP